jgi:DNA-binding CsgD family transcriptional regulator
MTDWARRGVENGRAVLSEEEVLQIARLWAEGKHSQRRLAKLFGVGQRTILDILQRKTWSHLWQPDEEQ